MLAQAKTIPGGRALAAKVEVSDPATLRELAEKLRDKLGDAIVLLGAVNGARASLVLTVSKGLTDRYKAGDLIKPVAQILGGSGGGRPDMAQAGGTEVGRIDEAMNRLYGLVEGS
jgi:alanyl-tRNA synthetase